MIMACGSNYGPDDDLIRCMSSLVSLVNHLIMMSIKTLKKEIDHGNK